MTKRTRRSGWCGFAVGAALAMVLSAGSSVSAEEKKAAPLPPGVMACDFGALANDRTRDGLAIHTEPRADSPVLGRLPVIDNIHQEKIAADLHVIGVSNGWFLVENAVYGDYDLPDKVPPVYAGRGWVLGKSLTTQLHYFTLKAAPAENAADAGNSAAELVSAILDCKGDWLRVEAPALAKDGAPPNTVRGWAHGVCTNQRTPCGG